jgi:hypothetical protein
MIAHIRARSTAQGGQSAWATTPCGFDSTCARARVAKRRGAFRNRGGNIEFEMSSAAIGQDDGGTLEAANILLIGCEDMPPQAWMLAEAVVYRRPHRGEEVTGNTPR